jgi:hypothetical protein
LSAFDSQTVTPTSVIIPELTKIYEKRSGSGPHKYSVPPPLKPVALTATTSPSDRISTPTNNGLMRLLLREKTDLNQARLR